MDAKISSHKKKLLHELTLKQLKNIPQHRRLTYRDLLRIVKHIDSSIFDKKKCCIWNGYVSQSNANSGNDSGTYINFFFRGSKVALHRLLFENFVDQIDNGYYIRYTCDTKNKKQICCNIHHMIKCDYTKQESEEESESESESEESNSESNLTLEFG